MKKSELFMKALSAIAWVIAAAIGGMTFNERVTLPQIFS